MHIVRRMLSKLPLRGNIEEIVKMATFKMTIDGRQVEADSSMTVLQAARKAGIFIPSLCAHDGLEPYGACRLCVVEIDGVRGTPTSCTTPAAEGMVVCTTSENLETQRRRTIELMMSSHPSPCMVCDSRADCEKEKRIPTRSTAATRCGTCSNRSGCELREVALGSYTREIGLPTMYDLSKVELNDPFIDKNHNLCILCGRCFRVCEKIHGKPAIGIANRGKRAKISSAFGRTWSSEECLFCGACVDACPTGCLTDRWGKWFGEPDKTAVSYCALCPKHCKIKLNIKDGKIISGAMVSLDAESAICPLGRFAMPQMINSPKRLRRAAVMRGKEQVPVSPEEAVEKLFEILSQNRGSILVISNKGATYESRKAMRAIGGEFGGKVIEMPLDSDASDLPADVAADLEGGKYAAVMEYGDYVSPEIAAKIPHFVVCDVFKTPAQKSAEVVLPISAFSETSGTLAAADGGKIAVAASVPSAGDQRPLNGYLCDVCKKSGMDVKKYDFELEPLAADFKSPTADKTALPKRILGHFLADYVPDLALLGLPNSARWHENEAKKNSEGFEILENKMLAPNFNEITVKAPEAAKFAKVGQFAILMANADSERSPFTIIDWNAEEGWIKFIIEQVGRSSAEIGALKKGDKLAVLSGPLGTPLDLERFKEGSSALLLGGCYGIAAILSIARALKKRGVKTTCAIEASSSYMLYYKEKFADVCDELLIGTRDGTEGFKGGCVNVMKERGKDFDSIVAIGCVFMMKQCASHAPENGAQMFCSLNPIMVDGTGMCGACRVSVGGQTKFACVEGPFFELDKVDFDELGKRRSAYRLIEIEAMPRHLGGKCHQ